ncbi:hypothetical protein KEM55_004274, partial [Ascosphaera atra]
VSENAGEHSRHSRSPKPAVSNPAFRIKLRSVSSFPHPCSLATSGRYVAPYLRRPSAATKEMRMPWTPTTQSRGAQGSKSERRVMLAESEGRSEGRMGRKRGSWKAL